MLSLTLSSCWSAETTCGTWRETLANGCCSRYTSCCLCLTSLSSSSCKCNDLIFWAVPSATQEAVHLKRQCFEHQTSRRAWPCSARSDGLLFVHSQSLKDIVPTACYACANPRTDLHIPAERSRGGARLPAAEQKLSCTGVGSCRGTAVQCPTFRRAPPLISNAQCAAQSDQTGLTSSGTVTVLSTTNV